jgi:hypothetical protein
MNLDEYRKKRRSISVLDGAGDLQVYCRIAFQMASGKEE